MHLHYFIQSCDSHDTHQYRLQYKAVHKSIIPQSQ